MSKEIFGEADSLWKRAEGAYKFSSKFNTFPYREGERIVDSFHRLAQEIRVPEIPKTQEDVFLRELRRRLEGEALFLEHNLSGHYYTFEDITNLYGIDKEDIDTLRDWLLENKEGTLEAIDRTYQNTQVEQYEIPVPVDIPRHRRQSEEFTLTYIEMYHRNFSALFSGLTPAGQFLRDIEAVPTTSERSYFSGLTKTLALGIPAICFITEDKTLHINERELIKIYGHEGMGHGLNKIVTDASDLPASLKRESESTRATSESVAQFYESVIFEELSRAPEVQRKLDISHKFQSIYKEERDTQLISQYQRRLFQYAIKVLADKELGDISSSEQRRSSVQRRVEALSEVALFPGYAVRLIEHYQNSFDSQGNLSFETAREMVYAAQPAKKVVEVMKAKGIEYDQEGRSKIDFVLLRGFWTPAGLVENSVIS